MKRNVTKEIKSIARERVGRVKAGKVIVPKTKKQYKYKVCETCTGRGFIDNNLQQSDYKCHDCLGTGKC